MKKNIIISLFLGLMLFFVSFDYGKSLYPNEFYNVFLDDKLLGTIYSEEELYKYIEEKTDIYVNAGTISRNFCPIDDEALELMENNPYEKYKSNGVDCVRIDLEDERKIEDVYNPDGLTVEKVLTYDVDLSNVEEVYNSMVDIKSFNVKGYQFIIRDEETDMVINVLDKDIFETSINEIIQTYVGSNEYEAYLSDNQVKIEATGNMIENVYISENITFIEKNIAVSERIFMDSDALSQYLLFGDNPVTSTYTVKENEEVETIAFNNKISIQEFLISNPKYQDENALIGTGTIVQIKETSPKISVVSEEFEVFDKVSEYQTVYQYDDTQLVTYIETIQDGSDGLERISQRVQKINGNITFVEPVSKEVLKATVNEIIVKGEKEVPNVGYLDTWAWPTASGWILTQDYEWRINPLYGYREFHRALDIAGTGYGSPIYAINNGTIITKEYRSDYGYMIVIDHNNGYYSSYSHLNGYAANINLGDTVSYGQLIAYMGSTGWSTGPHLHFEVWYGCASSSSCHINPWLIY